MLPMSLEQILQTHLLHPTHDNILITFFISLVSRNICFLCSFSQKLIYNPIEMY